MAIEEKKLTNKAHNVAVFKEIKKRESSIASLKATLKTVEPTKNATLAECNALARKSVQKS